MADAALTDLQVEVLRIFLSLPESAGFVLAGGAGLVAVGWSTRPTEDLDLFTAAASIVGAADALEQAVSNRAWRTERIQESPTFLRVVLRTDRDEVLVDLAQDAGPLSAATITPVGPAYPPAELAARKVLALFDRAALRNFVDVAKVSERYDREELLRAAVEIDDGFDVSEVQRIAFLRSAYTLVETTVVLLVTLLLFTKVESRTTDAVLLGVISLVFIYILRLLRLLDAPFRAERVGLDDISLFQIEAIHDRMHERLDGDARAEHQRDPAVGP